MKYIKLYFGLLGRCAMFMYSIIYRQGFSVGKHALVYGVPYLLKGNGSKISFGDGVTITNNSFFNSISIPKRCFFRTARGATIIVGNDVGMSGVVISARKKIVIDDDVLIGSGVIIMDSDFHNLSDLHGPIPSVPVSIGRGCFIGARSIILKGTVLGENVVVGAGSVVSGTFEDNTIIVGNPAQVVSYRDLTSLPRV